MGLLIGIRPGSRRGRGATLRRTRRGLHLFPSRSTQTSYAGGPDFWNPFRQHVQGVQRRARIDSAARSSALPTTIVGSSDAGCLSKLPSGAPREAVHPRAPTTTTRGRFRPATVCRSAAALPGWPPAGTSTTRLTSTSKPSSPPARTRRSRNSTHDSRINYNGGFQTYNYLRFSPPSTAACPGRGPTTTSSRVRDAGQVVALGSCHHPPLGTRLPAALLRQEHHGQPTRRSPSSTLSLNFVGGQSSRRPKPDVTDGHQQSPLLPERQCGCAGWRGLSHYMMAGWTSDSGQRIGRRRQKSRAVGGGGAGLLHLRILRRRPRRTRRSRCPIRRCSGPAFRRSPWPARRQGWCWCAESVAHNRGAIEETSVTECLQGGTGATALVPLPRLRRRPVTSPPARSAGCCAGGTCEAELFHSVSDEQRGTPLWNAARSPPESTTW